MLINLDVQPLKQLYKNAETNFAILSCKVKKGVENVILNNYGNITLIGYIAHFKLNKTYTVNVTQEEHSKYGLQYRVTTTNSLTAEDIENISLELSESLLMCVTSETRTHNILNAYPDFVKMVASGETEQIDFHKIHNVGKKTLTKCIEQLEQHLLGVLLQNEYKDYQLTPKELDNLLVASQNSIDIARDYLNTEPYIVLYRIMKRSFVKTDTVLQVYREDLKQSPQRCECMVDSILKANELKGNTYINARNMALEVKQYAPEILPILKEVVEDNCNIHYDPIHNSVARTVTYELEHDIAQTVLKLMQYPTNYNINIHEYYKLDNGIILSEEQQKILKYVNENNIVLLQGYAGTGKTSSIQALVNMLKDNGLTYTLLAPTGIAAKQLSNSTGCATHTIHRYLQMNEKGYTNCTINTDVCIVDEVSMCGVLHIGTICRALEPHTKLVLVGDSAQLASIACGNVTHDLLKWKKIPQISLTHVFRYGEGGIDTVATDIRNEQPFLNECGEPIYAGAKNDTQYTFIKADSSPIEQIIEQYTLLRKTYNKEDIMVLIPFNVGKAGTYAVNKAIQQKFNNQDTKCLLPKSHPVDFFCKTDRVLNIENWYDAPIYYEATEEASENESCSIYNGDIGTITHIVSNSKSPCIYVDFDNALVRYRPSEFNKLLLGDVLTCHKSQGIGVKAILLYTDHKHKQMLSNNLLYVAVTRAKEKIIHIGDVATINTAINLHETDLRNTCLYNLLKEGEQ